MTLNELKGKYARLSNEIDGLAAAGGNNQARLTRLLNDLDQVHQQLTELRRRTFAAPTLRDAVDVAPALVAAPRADAKPPAAKGAGSNVVPMPMAAKLSLAM